jgi:hypothetical protein
LEVRSEEEVQSTKLEVRSEDKVLPTTDNRQPTTNSEKVQSTELEVRSEDKVLPTTDNRQPTTNNEEVQSTKLEVQSEDKVLPTTDNQQPTTKISALSLASIRAKKEMAVAQKSVVKETQHLPNEPFTETEMLEQWLKYAQRMEDKGYRIIASLLTINDPILEGTTIIHELPNESSKIDFEKERPELLGYLRGKLHNHDIQIVVKVNETLVVKKAFTNQDKYNRLVEINPNLEVLKKMFDLDV